MINQESFITEYLRAKAEEDKKFIVFIDRYSANLQVIPKRDYINLLQPSLLDMFDRQALVEKTLFHALWEEIGPL